ncbi:hypothetical protein DLAC_08559 [Tieghemostelium lacteum]|uniref:EGF-like domain-containing protein n=1 Tax=Tieghemostelium lacteum TaxID=361077 RepID=A0A151Z7Q4_TIELA|nr:hypothetical protein DLAC_08559 [Tieghemostelium lacteum]|eukprot:KYQ89990.1 hypothetical protein DLAC_08559 [Tieghemostelium lacteum]
MKVFIKLVLIFFGIINLTQKGINDAYAQYVDSCEFIYQILLKAELNDTDISSVTSSITNSTIYLISNDNRNYYFEYLLDVPLNSGGGNISNAFQVNGNSIGGTIEYHCEPSPHPLINRNPFKQFKRSQQPYMYYISLDLGLKKQLHYQIDFPQSNGYFCSYYDQGYSLIVVECLLVALNATTDIQFNIVAQNKITTFIFPSFLKQSDLNPTVSTYEYFDYPNSNTGYKQYYYFVQFTDLYGPFYQIDNPNEYAQNIFYNEPISGNLESTFTVLYYTNLENLSTHQLSTKFLKGNQIETVGQISYTPLVINGGSVVGVTFNQFVNSSVDYEVYLTISNYQSFSLTISQGVEYQGLDLPYPHSVIGRVGNDFILKVVFMVSEITSNFMINYQGTILVNSTVYNNQPIDTSPPGLSNVEIVPINGYLFLIRIQAYDDTGLAFMYVNLQYLTKTDLVSGSLKNGTFEKIVNITNDIGSLYERSVILYDTYDNRATFSPIYGSDFKEIPSFSSFLPHLGTTQISFIRYAMNDIDVSLIGCNNTMFINFTNPIINQIVLVSFDLISFSGIWNPDEQLFTVNFPIDARMFSGYIEYRVSYYYQEYDSRNFPESWKLRVYSEYADKMPPLITNIATSNPILNALGGTISWTFTIEDEHNGLSHGVFCISSTSFTFSQLDIELDMKDKNIYSDNYTIEIQVPPGCLAQSYYISSVSLVDTSGHQSSQDTSVMVLQNGGTTWNGYISPFMKMLNDTSMISKLSIPVDCLTPNSDVTPPAITSLLIYSNDNSSSINLFSNKRSIYINFTVQDTESPISQQVIPKCYIYTSFYQLETTAELKSFDDSVFTAQFQCVLIDVGYGYGYPRPNLLVSVNGLSDIKMNLKGYSSDDLQVAGFNSSIETVFIKQPIISSTSPIPNTGDQLTVFGYGFGIENTTTLKIDYEDSTTVSKSPVFLTDTFLIIDGIKPNQSKFNITAINLIQSNVLLVEPYFIPQPKPQIPCEGNPICGGPSNGVCTFFGCVCFYPWTSNDCMSQIIIIPQPGIVPKKPNLDLSFPLPGGEEVTLSGLIRIESLREMTPDKTAFQNI